MTPEQKYKIQRCEVLLQNSPLSAEMKAPLLGNLAKMPDVYIDRILKSLEREVIEIESLKRAISEFEQFQEKGWKELEEQQVATSKQLLDSTISSLSN